MLSRKVVVIKPKEVAIQEVDIPNPSERQILVKTSNTLISTGTELTMFSNDFPQSSHWDEISRYPFTLGYSNCGRIVDVGEGVEKYRVGDRVATSAPHAEYALVEADRACKVPEGVSDEEATFATLAATVMNGVRLASISLGECVVILGVGILGQLACQFGRLCGGFPTIAVDLSERRLEVAKELGVNATLQPGKDDVKEFILSLTKNRGADVVFEITGNPEALSWGLSLVKRQGRYVILSSPRGPSTVDFHDEVNWPSRLIIGAHTSSHPSLETPYNPWTRNRNIELFFHMLSAGIINVKRLVTHGYKWTEVKDAYQMLLDPTGERLQAIGVILDYK